MNRQWIYLIWISTLFIFLTGCDRPKGFTLQKITSYHKNDPRWNASPLTIHEEDQLRQILSEPFTYFGSGNHCYAFISSDGNFMLKLFKQKHMSTRSFIDWLPSPAKCIFHPTKKYTRHMQEREKSFNSYKIAYDYLKKETGVFYLHLNKTNHLNQTVTLISQNDHTVFVDIDKMEFLIQKKAQVGYSRLEELFNEGKLEEALKSIASLFSIILKRMEKGFCDKDLQLFKNFGFIDNQAMEIDIGELYFSPSQYTIKCQKQELVDISKQLIFWVSSHYPDYRSDVEVLTNEILNKNRE